MSSGQRPRTREHFPRMKVRGRRRRTRAQVQALQGINWDEVATGFMKLGAAAATVLDAITTAAESVARVGEAWVTQCQAYLGSERFQLDLIAVQYKGDPMGHSAAVGEFFTARAHRELDELAVQLELSSTWLMPWQLRVMEEIFRGDVSQVEAIKWSALDNPTFIDRTLWHNANRPSRQ